MCVYFGLLKIKLRPISHHRLWLWAETKRSKLTVPNRKRLSVNCNGLFIYLKKKLFMSFQIFNYYYYFIFQFKKVKNKLNSRQNSQETKELCHNSCHFIIENK